MLRSNCFETRAFGNLEAIIKVSSLFSVRANFIPLLNDYLIELLDFYLPVMQQLLIG
jgi:hypothetical protein